MRVSFVLRSAEASSLGLCNTSHANYRDISSLTCENPKHCAPGHPTIGTSNRDLKKSRQLRGVPGRSPSPVLTRPCIA